MVKSRLQAGQAHAQRYKSALDGVLTILKEEGVEGLYKGVGSKLTQSVLTAAILFAGQKRIYEMTKKVRFRFLSSVLYDAKPFCRHLPPCLPSNLYMYIILF